MKLKIYNVVFYALDEYEDDSNSYLGCDSFANEDEALKELENIKNLGYECAIKINEISL